MADKDIEKKQEMTMMPEENCCFQMRQMLEKINQDINDAMGIPPELLGQQNRTGEVK